MKNIILVFAILLAIYNPKNEINACDINILSNHYPYPSIYGVKYWKVSYSAVEKWQNLAKSNIKLYAFALAISMGTAERMFFPFQTGSGGIPQAAPASGSI